MSVESQLRVKRVAAIWVVAVLAGTHYVRFIADGLYPYNRLRGAVADILGSLTRAAVSMLFATAITYGIAVAGTDMRSAVGVIAYYGATTAFFTAYNYTLYRRQRREDTCRERRWRVR